MGWEKMEPAQVEEGHDVADRMHWDICCLKRAELQEKGLWLEKQLWLTVLVQPQFVDLVPEQLQQMDVE